jgi:hypothetical protein
MLVYVQLCARCAGHYLPLCFSLPASWYQPMGVDAPHGHVDDKGEKASFKKGAEDSPRNSLLFRSHRAPGEGRSVPEEVIARRLSGRLVGRRN